MSTGLLMLDLEGTSLTSEEKILLKNKEVGGVILFSRNFTSITQLKALTQSIHAIRPNFLLAVDQEGGRVQRFKGHGFTTLPPMAALGNLFDHDPAAAKIIAYNCGNTTGKELKSCHINVNLAPVLDINRLNNKMLGRRCFGTTVKAVIDLTYHYIKGLQDAGVSAVGKHFPGHGGVRGDTHISLPKDSRTIKALQEDVKPFANAIKNNIAAIMPSHVVYPEACKEPAGFSSYWLHTVLREQLNFEGAVFSDCLNMAAASIAGGFAERAEKALKAGCDIILVCNNRKGAIETLEWLKNYEAPQIKLKRLHSLQQNQEVSENLELKQRQLAALIAEHQLLDRHPTGDRKA